MNEPMIIIDIWGGTGGTEHLASLVRPVGEGMKLAEAALEEHPQVTLHSTPFGVLEEVLKEAEFDKRGKAPEIADPKSCLHEKLYIGWTHKIFIHPQDADKPALESRRGWHACLRMTCLTCNEPFYFLGVSKSDGKTRWNVPMVDASGCELEAPVAPLSMIKESVTLMMAFTDHPMT